MAVGLTVGVGDAEPVRVSEGDGEGVGDKVSVGTPWAPWHEDFEDS